MKNYLKPVHNYRCKTCHQMVWAYAVDGVATARHLCGDSYVTLTVPTMLQRPDFPPETLLAPIRPRMTYVCRPIVDFELARHKRRMGYVEYLHSPRWRPFRHRVYTKYPCCVLCWHQTGVLNDQDLNIAHLIYVRRGHEREDDVSVLGRTHYFAMDDGKFSQELAIQARDAFRTWWRQQALARPY